MTNMDFRIIPIHSIDKAFLYFHENFVDSTDIETPSSVLSRSETF